MDLRSCTKCERAYSFDGNALCPKCRYEDDGDFKIVKEYLYDNPGADIKAVAQDTEVEVRKILQYLKEGRISITAGSENTALSCERCDASINIGKYCNKCVNEMKKEINGAIDSSRKGKEAIESNSSSKNKKQEKAFIVERYKE